MWAVIVLGVLGLIAAMLLLLIGAMAILGIDSDGRRVKVIIPWWYWPMTWLLFIGSCTALAVAGDRP